MPPASLSAKPLTRPGPSTPSTAASRSRAAVRGVIEAGQRTRRTGDEGTGQGLAAGRAGTYAPARPKTRGSRRFQAVGRTVSIASSTVTIPRRTPWSSTTGTASRL